MLRSVEGVYDSGRLKFKEPVEVKGKANVLVTFLNDVEVLDRSKSYLARLLNRKPVKIAPLTVKDLIEEGRR